MTDPVLKSLMIIREDAHKRGMVDVGEALDRSLRRLWAKHMRRQADELERRIFPKWEGGNGV